MVGSATRATSSGVSIENVMLTPSPGASGVAHCTRIWAATTSGPNGASQSPAAQVLLIDRSPVQIGSAVGVRRGERTRCPRAAAAVASVGRLSHWVPRSVPLSTTPLSPWTGNRSTTRMAVAGSVPELTKRSR